MRKIIAIGESSYDIIFRDNTPQRGFPGGRILNATASIARTGIPTTFVSECAADYLGDQVVNFLSEHGVDTHSVDRFTEGATKAVVIYETGTVEYGKYPNDRFDVVWPRIDEDDIIIFGSLYSVDNDLRNGLYEILKYAQERKAIIVYIPGFQRDQNFRMTKVMTAMLENLELSNLVITNSVDIQNVFSEKTPDEAFSEKIEYYCPNYIHIDTDKSSILYTDKKRKTFSSPCVIDNKIKLGWRSGFIAGIAYGIIANDVQFKDINSTSIDVWSDIINAAYTFAFNSNCESNTITVEFGEKKAQELRAKLDNKE